MKILYVEDEIAHVELTQRTLEDNLKDNFVLFHRDSYKSALALLADEPNVDIVLSDLRLPDGSGLDLLKEIQKMKLPPAVVLVTGQGDEEVAVTALKAGAADYLVKQSNYLQRLPVVITNAVAQNKLAREQAAKLEAEIRYQNLVEQTPAVVFLGGIDEHETTIYISPRIEELTGYTPEEWQADPLLWENNIHVNDRERILTGDRRTRGRGDSYEDEYRFIRRDGRVVWIKEDTNLIRDKNGNPLYLQGILIDITMEKENEDALQRQLKELTILNAVTAAGTEGNSEDEIIERFVNIASLIYNEVCGVLLLNELGNILTPHPSYHGANIINWQKSTPITNGITGKCVMEGASIRLGDVSTESDFIEIATGINSELCVPIQVNKKIIGVFNVESQKPNAFDREDEQFLTTVSGSLGTSLERLRLFAQEQRRSRELNALYQATKSLAQSLKPELIADYLFETIEELLGYEFASIYLFDEKDQELIPLAISVKSQNLAIFDRDLEALAKEKRALGQGIIGWVAQNGQSIRSGDVNKEQRYLPVIGNIRSELCVPLLVRDKVVGTINVETTKPDAYKARDEDLLTALANSAAIAFENARLYEAELSRREQAETLQAVTARLSTSLDINVLYQIILESLAKLINYDSASIFLEGKNGEIEIVAGTGFIDQDKSIGKKIPASIKWQELSAKQKALIIPDIQADKRFEQWTTSEKIRGWMGIPMIAQEKAIGFINIDSLAINPFTQRDATLAQTYANSAAVAIQNAFSFHAEREQRKREEAMLELMRVTTSTLELDIVMQAILDQMINLIPSDSGTIQLLEGDELRVTAMRGFYENTLAHGRILKLGESPLNDQALKNAQPIWSNNVKQDSDYRLIKEAESINSFMVIPLVYKSEVIGVATLDSQQLDRYSAEDAEFAFAIANQAAIAIGNVRLYQAALTASERRAVLHRISQDIVRFTQDPEQIYTAIHEAAEKLMPCDLFLVSLYSEVSDENIYVYIVEEGKRFSFKNEPANKGLLGKIINEGSSIILRNEDEIEAEEFSHFGSPAHVNSLMAVPMRAGGNIIGMISAQSYETNSYGREELSLLEMLATHAATAIENARLFQEESRRTQIIETLVDIANEIATKQDIMPVLDKVTQRAMDLLHANHVAIFMLHDQNNVLKAISAKGIHSRAILSQTLKIGEGITGTVVATGKPEIIKLVANDHRRRPVAGTPETDSENETLMSAPLILRGRPVGALNAWRLRTDGVFTQVELNFLTSIANQVSIAIESSNLFRETIRHAQESAAIAEVGRDISATLQLDIVLNRIATYAMELLHSESSAVYLPDPNMQVMRAIAAQGLDAEQIMNDPLDLGAGILGGIALKKTGEIVNDTINDPRTIIILGTDQNIHEHIMGVPVLEKNQLTGLVAVWRNGIDNEFTSSDLEFLGSLAQQASTAIKNARLYDEAQRRLREMEAINRLSSSMRSTQSQTEMCNILLDETLNLLDAKDGSVWIQDSVTTMVFQRAARGSATRVKHSSLKHGEGIVGHVLSTGKSYFSPELKNDPLLFRGNRDVIFDGFCGVGIPIYSIDGILGVLTVQLESSRRADDYISLLGTLAEIAGNSIHRADLFDQSQEQIRKLITLRDIDSAIASSTDLRVTLNILMDHTLRHLKVDAVDILLYHPELQNLTYLCSAGFRSSSPTRPLLRIGEGLAGQVVMKGRIEQIDDLQSTFDFQDDPLLKYEGFVSYIGVPLIVKGQIKGLFELFHRSHLSPTEDWMQFLQTLTGQAAIAIDNSQLFDNLQRSNQEIRQAYDTTLEGWARALELRDRETEGHTRRVMNLTMQLARYMSIGEDELVNIYRGVLLHDIGKMGVPDQILRKTGPLNDNEWVEMRKHPQYAFDLLSPIPYLRPALDIPYCHHEHWDGSGYPRGLKGEQIPLSARVFSIVDIWDALLSDRPYRNAWPRKKVIEYLKEISGQILDPKVVDAFLDMIGADDYHTSNQQ